MKILHITPSFQHPTMRGPSRHYHFVRELSQRHDITLLSLTRAPVTPEAMEEMSTYTERIMTFGTHAASRPNRVHQLTKALGPRLHHEIDVRKATAAMKTAVRELLAAEPFDVVLFHGKFLFSVIEDVQAPIVVDFCDATSMRIESKMRYAPHWYRPLLWARHRQVKALERRLVDKTPHLAFISPRDRNAVLAQRQPAVVVPNGVDHRYWQRRADAKPGEQCIIFTGVMDYAPNDDAAMYLLNEIVPFVRRAQPDLEVIIAGRDPSERLQERAREIPGVQVTGFVEDMRTWYERATVCVAPIRYASGMQNKVLEALAMRVPVVATPVVANGVRMQGSDAPLCTANDPLEFAETTVRLLRHPEERQRLSLEGRRFVEKHFSWRRSAAALEQMCFTAAGHETNFEHQRRQPRNILEVMP